MKIKELENRLKLANVKNVQQVAQAIINTTGCDELIEAILKTIAYNKPMSFGFKMIV
ncbi:MAG: hypothetical protein V3U75_13095 [Methylococcaceae bacterium]